MHEEVDDSENEDRLAQCVIHITSQETVSMIKDTSITHTKFTKLLILIG